MSWPVADERKTCTCARTFWTSTDVRQDAQAALESDNTRRDCRARVEQEMLAKGDAIKLETRQEQEGNPKDPEASPKKRKTGESDVNPGGAPSSAAGTFKEVRI